MKFFKPIFIILLLICNFYLTSSPYFKKGQTYYANGNYDLAIKNFESAIKENRNEGKPYFFIGLILESRRKFSSSIRYLEQSIEKKLSKKYKKIALWKIISYYKRLKNFNLLLQYANKFKQLNGSNDEIEALIEEASNHANPALSHANTYLLKAQEQERDILSHKADANFWILYKNELLNIAKNYENAYSYNPDYQNFLWNAAYYYEKLEHNQQALNIYKKLTASSNSSKAYYKIGVLQKKMRNYQAAYNNLSLILNDQSKTPLSKKMLLYVYLNLSQSALALNKIDESYKYIKTIFQNHHSSLKQPLKQLSTFLYCLSVIHPLTQNTQLTSLNIKQQSECGKLLKLISIDTVNEEQKDLFYFILFNYKYSQHLKKKNSNAKSLYSYYKKFIQTEDILLSDWIPHYINPITNFLYSYEYYDELNQILNQYSSKLNSIPNYYNMLAVCYFYKQDYQSAIRYYKLIHKRSMSEQKKFLISYAQTKQWSELKQELLRYATYVSQKEIKKTFRFIKKDSSFTPFLHTNEYLSLKEIFY